MPKGRSASYRSPRRHLTSLFGALGVPQNPGNQEPVEVLHEVQSDRCAGSQSLGKVSDLPGISVSEGYVTDAMIAAFSRSVIVVPWLRKRSLPPHDTTIPGR